MDTCCPAPCALFHILGFRPQFLPRLTLDTAVGKGIFAKIDIEQDTLLGEYLGELLPLNAPQDNMDAYQFTLDNICIISEFLNIYISMLGLGPSKWKSLVEAPFQRKAHWDISIKTHSFTPDNRLG